MYHRRPAVQRVPPAALFTASHAYGLYGAQPPARGEIDGQRAFDDSFRTQMKDAAEEAIRNLELSVRFIVTDYTVEFVADKVRSQEYYVPEYQREMIWDDAVQSRFIESVLIGLPIPFVFLWQDEDGRLEIVDGSQRMRTLRRFMDNELKLTKLELLPETNEFHYRDLSEARQRKFNARTLRGIVLENATTDRHADRDVRSYQHRRTIRERCGSSQRIAARRLHRPRDQVLAQYDPFVQTHTDLPETDQRERA